MPHVIYTMGMEETQQRKRIHTTLSQMHYKRLQKFRNKMGFPSISSTIEHLIMERSIGEKLDVLIKAMESRYVQPVPTPDGIPDIDKIPNIPSFSIIDDEDV